MATPVHIAKPLAPEDIRTGDLVAPLHVTYEFPSFFWCGDSAVLPPSEPVRIQQLPPGSGIPLKVKAVCLPFVFVASPSGEPQALDVRQYQLARLAPSYGERAWRTLKKEWKAQRRKNR